MISICISSEGEKSENSLLNTSSRKLLSVHMIHSTSFYVINDGHIPSDPKPWKLVFYNNLIA